MPLLGCGSHCCEQRPGQWRAGLGGTTHTSVCIGHGAGDGTAQVITITSVCVGCYGTLYCPAHAEVRSEITLDDVF